MSDVYEREKLYGDGFGAGYAQAISDADAELRKRGDDFLTRRHRQAILALVCVPFAPEHVMPRPDWTKYRVSAVRDYPKPGVSIPPINSDTKTFNPQDCGFTLRDEGADE